MTKRSWPQPTSSNVAIAAASAFLVLAGTLSFVGDPADPTSGWHLRGTLAPQAAPAPPAPTRLPAPAKPV